MRRTFNLILLLGLFAFSHGAAARLATLRLLTAGVADSGAAARQASEMTGGRVVDVRTLNQNGRTTYVVKVLLEDGRVRVVELAGSQPDTGGR